MKITTLAVIVTLALTLARVDAANLRQLTDTHANSHIMGRMEAHKTTVARMEGHKITPTKMESHKATQTKMDGQKATQAKMERHKATQTKMESQFKLPFNLGKIFSSKPATTAPPRAVQTSAPPVPVATDVETTDEPILISVPEERVQTEEPQRPHPVGSYPRPNQYNPSYYVVVNNDYP